jgi:DNA repair exonuclease SbcCD ATPase subunit
MTTDLDELTIRVRNQRRILDSRAGEARSIGLRGREIQIEIQNLVAAQGELDRVTLFFNSLGEEKQNAAQKTIEGIVTQGLQMIFQDEALSFHIRQSIKAKSANVDFVIRTTLKNTVVETGVMDARGGGLAAVVGFLLRLTVMLLRDGARSDNLLVLDETFAHVSAEYLEPLGQFIREIVEKTGVQVIMVTHQPELAEHADAVYRFSQDDTGKTKVDKDA